MQLQSLTDLFGEWLQSQRASDPDRFLREVRQTLRERFSLDIERSDNPPASSNGTVLAEQSTRAGTLRVTTSETEVESSRRELASLVAKSVARRLEELSDGEARKPDLDFFLDVQSTLSDQETPETFKRKLGSLMDRHLSLGVEGVWVQDQGSWTHLGDEPPSPSPDQLPLPAEFTAEKPVVRRDGSIYFSVRNRDRSLGLIRFDAAGWDPVYSRYLRVLSPFLGMHFQRQKQLATAALHETFEFGRGPTPSLEKLKSFQAVDEILQSLVRTIARLFECDNCRLFWLESEQTLYLRSESRESGDHQARVSIDEDPLVQSVIDQEKAVLINDLPEQQPGRRANRGVRSLLAVPFRYRQSVLGTLNLSSENPDVYTREDLQLLSEVCDNFATIYGITQEYANLTSYVEEVLTNLPVGVVHYLLDKEKLVLNQAARDILRIPQENVPLEQFEVHLEEKLGAPDLYKLLEVDGQNRPEQGDFELSLGEARPLVVEAMSSTVKDVEGQTTGVLMVLADVTEQRKLTRQMNRTERLTALGELASSLAHEIKNPLTSIQGFVQLIPDRTEDPEFLEKTAGILEDEARRLNALVENLLSFGKPQVGSRSEVLLADIVEDLKLLINKRIEEENLTLRTSLPADLTVYADPLKIKQVLLNLSLNAVEAMGEGGELTIEAHDDGDGFVTIVVRDTGEGMTEEEVKKIFNPFFTTKDDGTGLGMAISHRIVEEHGGSIRVDSRPGEGTEIRVELPPQENRQTESEE